MSEPETDPAASDVAVCAICLEDATSETLAVRAARAMGNFFPPVARPSGRRGRPRAGAREGGLSLP